MKQIKHFLNLLMILGAQTYSKWMIIMELKTIEITNTF